MLYDMSLDGMTANGFPFRVFLQADAEDKKLVHWYCYDNGFTEVCQGTHKMPRTLLAIEKLVGWIGDQVELVEKARELNIYWKQHGPRYIEGTHYRYHCELRDQSAPGAAPFILGSISLPDESVALPISDFKSWEEGRLWMAAAIHAHQQGKRIPNIWEGPVLMGAKLYEPPAA